MDDRSINKEKVEAYIADLEPNIQVLANALRQLILETSDDLEEVYK